MTSPQFFKVAAIVSGDSEMGMKDWLNGDCRKSLGMNQPLDTLKKINMNSLLKQLSLSMLSPLTIRDHSFLYNRQKNVDYVHFFH